MDWKKLGKTVLFPPVFIIFLLLPFSTGTLIYGMLFLVENDWRRIAAYVFSFYSLLVLCARIPKIVTFCKSMKENNRYIRTWSEDVQLRTKIILMGNVLWNCGYALLQLGIGIYHHSVWFYSLAGYYFSLAVMRLFLLAHAFRYQFGEKRRAEWKWYRNCGWVFLLMNLALSRMMLYMVRGERIVRHSEITTITMAAYTFASFSMAVRNMVVYKKYESPVLSASKIISLAAVSVSVMTLENTMLYTFRTETMTLEKQRVMQALTGAAIALFIVIMAIHMIRKADQEIRYMEDDIDEK